MAQGVVGAIGELNDVQQRFGARLFEIVAGRPIVDADRVPLGPDALAAELSDDHTRSMFMHLLVLLELLVHPVPAELQRVTERYGEALGVTPPLLSATRAMVREHYALAYLDLARNSWYVEQTVAGSLHGQLYEFFRSEVAYLGVGDRRIAQRWRGLADLPAGTWGREVDEFYERNRFPRPGEAHGIYELGALHDWVHVLTGYGTDPVGEIQVFGFIAANMRDPKGFTLLAVTLGLFQTGTISHMHGKRVRIATVDALDVPGASEGLATAISHGLRCEQDVMNGLDFFELADRPLVEMRAELGIAAAGLA